MNVKGLHIELTNKCTLKCPRCARTTFIEKFKTKSWRNRDLSLDSLKRFLDIDLTDINILLCGNYGDPIYYDDLFLLIDWLKSQQAKVSIVTNGSYKTRSWWEELKQHLTSSDSVTFSVDGIPENFHLYRVNGDWDSIQEGMTVLAKSDINTTWKYIPFKFNEETIDQARKISESIGIKNFSVAVSDRWLGSDDPLMPVKKNLQNAKTESVILWKEKKLRDVEIDPKCYNNNYHYISADGFYSPCCFVATWPFYYSSQFFKNNELYSIEKNTLSEILIREESFFNNLKKDKHSYCTFNCPKI